MGFTWDILKDAISRQVFSSRGERTIIKQNNVIIRAINDDRKKQGQEPLHMKEESDFKPLWKITKVLVWIFGIIIPLMLIWVWINLANTLP